MTGSTPERPEGQLTRRAPAPRPLSVLSAHWPGHMPCAASSPPVRQSPVCEPLLGSSACERSRRERASLLSRSELWAGRPARLLVGAPDLLLNIFEVLTPVRAPALGALCSVPFSKGILPPLSRNSQQHSDSRQR